MHPGGGAARAPAGKGRPLSLRTTLKWRSERPFAQAAARQRPI